jgi:dipeptidyl aminopeptidase/acylaminoacyl peptidase
MNSTGEQTMRVLRLACRLLVAGAFCCAAAASAAELPISDFVKHATLRNPVISPDGKYLAVVVNENTDNPDADYQLAVLQLPDLKPVSRLDMAPRYMPYNVHWVSNTRLIMGLAEETGTLVEPSVTGDIIGVDYDGRKKETLYSSVSHRGGLFSNVNSLKIPSGFPSIAGTPLQPNGHFFLALNRVRVGGTTANIWEYGKSGLYDVDSATGHAVLIGEIDHGGMSLLAHDGVARIAAGSNTQMHAAAFHSTDGRTWKPLPESVVGKSFDPLTISADGKHLYALSSLDGGPDQLIECDLDGGNRKVLASDSFSSVTDVMWNPETRTPVAAVFAAGGKPKVQYISNGIYAQVMQALARAQPDAFVSMEGASADGAALLISVRSDRNPGALALFDKAHMHARPLYQVLPWIDPARMPVRMPIRFTDRAGVELAGFLTLPNGGDHKNLPLVLIPHGGPIGPSDGWFYDPWAALLADRGYASLQINYRGSGERGFNFGRSGYRQFATGIQEDLVDGVKWAIAQGYVDPNRICVFGGSFGGYSSLMQPILAPGLYKCAVDYAGVYDWRIGMDRSDTRRFAGGQVYFKDAIGTREDAYAMSPVSMMDKFNVPVLIAHGKDDPRVPYQNATDLRSYLDKAGKPYEWLAQPGELHGFASEEHNEEFFGMITAFLAKHIGPGDAAPAKSAGAAPE